MAYPWLLSRQKKDLRITSAQLQKKAILPFSSVGNSCIERPVAARLTPLPINPLDLTLPGETTLGEAPPGCGDNQAGGGVGYSTIPDDDMVTQKWGPGPAGDSGGPGAS